MNLPNFKSGTLQVADQNEIYWESCGNPDGIPVLLIHGGSGFTFDLSGMSAFDLQKHLIITWHQRGEGKSAHLPHTNDAGIFSHAADAEALRNHLAIEKWHIFSWSFGALFMTAYACLYPQRCSSLQAYAPFLGSKEDWDILLTKAPRFAQGLNAHYGVKDIFEAKRKAVERADTWDKKSRLTDLFQRAVLEGYKGSEQKFLQSKTARLWDRELDRIARADRLYNEAINERGQGWLYNLSRHNTAFRSLPTTFFFGADDIYAAPNATTSLIYPRAALIMVPHGTHDVHSHAVQTAIRKKTALISPKLRPLNHVTQRNHTAR